MEFDFLGGDTTMTTRRALLASLSAVAAAFSLSACNSDNTAQKAPVVAAETKDSSMQVVIFHAGWCPYCAVHTPAMKDYADKNPARMRLTVIDVDANKDLVDLNAVKGLPTTLLMRDGVVVGRHEGVLDAEKISTMIDAAQKRAPLQNIAATIKTQQPAPAASGTGQPKNR